MISEFNGVTVEQNLAIGFCSANVQAAGNVRERRILPVDVEIAHLKGKFMKVMSFGEKIEILAEDARKKNNRKFDWSQRAQQ